MKNLEQSVTNSVNKSISGETNTKLKSIEAKLESQSKTFDKKLEANTAKFEKISKEHSVLFCQCFLSLFNGLFDSSMTSFFFLFDWNETKLGPGLTHKNINNLDALKWKKRVKVNFFQSV